MPKTMTIREFFLMFPDDDTCLAHLFEVRYGDNPCPPCGGRGSAFASWRRCPPTPAIAATTFIQWCDTPFLRTRTPLQKWFYAMFLFTTTRNGVAAKEIQSQMGVTYKTAWRMAKRSANTWAMWTATRCLAVPGGPIVEADKPFHRRQGHERTKMTRPASSGWSSAAARFLPATFPIDRQTRTQHRHQNRKFVLPGSRVATDEAYAFKGLVARLPPRRRNHVEKGIRARHRSHQHHRSLLVDGESGPSRARISGCRSKHFPKYLGEIEFRWNFRKRPS